MKIQTLVVVVALLAAFASAQRFETEFYCPDGPVIQNGLTPECGTSSPNGSYPLQHRCNVTCPLGTEPNATFVKCRNATLNNIPEGGTVWLPENTICESNPDLRCLTPPAPPFSFGVEGSFTCDPVNGRPGGGWNLGDTCDYHCPEGWTPVGDEITICTVDLPVNTFQPGPPCCEPPCTLEEASDVLFIVQQSPCFDESWSDITSFLVDVLSEFKSDQIHAAFVFYGLDGPIEDTLIAFSKIDENLKNQVRNTPFDFYTAGSHGVTTIEEAVRNIYEGPALHRRPDVPDNVIFVMDTRSVDRQVIDDLDNLVEASDDLKEKVEEVFVVGIGDFERGNPDFSEELHIIASRSEYVYEVSNIGDADPHLPARVVCRRCPDEATVFGNKMRLPK